MTSSAISRGSAGVDRTGPLPQPLWDAAYLINGGCSDDGFDYFRGWLVDQGRETFERCLAEMRRATSSQFLSSDEANHDLWALLPIRSLR